MFIHGPKYSFLSTRFFFPMRSLILQQCVKQPSSGNFYIFLTEQKLKNLAVVEEPNGLKGRQIILLFTDARPSDDKLISSDWTSRLSQNLTCVYQRHKKPFPLQYCSITTSSIDAPVLMTSQSKVGRRWNNSWKRRLGMNPNQATVAFYVYEQEIDLFLRWWIYWLQWRLRKILKFSELNATLESNYLKTMLSRSF